METLSRMPNLRHSCWGTTLAHPLTRYMCKSQRPTSCMRRPQGVHRANHRSQVSARILSKADRLFTNRLSQIFVELLQNARRAGASLVTVTTSPSPTDSTSLITFTDNGSGIDDFNKLLHLGESGWDEAVERAEDPAGMGLFALLHTGVVVSSRGKTATITTDAFLGKEAVQVHDQDSVDPKTGTTVVFAREETEAAILDTLLRVARFGPVDVNAQWRTAEA